MIRTNLLVMPIVVFFLQSLMSLAETTSSYDCLLSETGRLDFSLCQATPNELYSVGFDNVKDISAFDDFAWGVNLLKAAAARDHVLACALLHALGRNYVMLLSRPKGKYEKVSIDYIGYHQQIRALSRQLNPEAKLVYGLAGSLLSANAEGIKVEVDINDWLNKKSESYLEAGKWFLRSLDDSSVGYRHYISFLRVYKAELLGLDVAKTYRLQLEAMLLKLKGPAFIHYYKSMAEHWFETKRQDIELADGDA